MATAYLILSGWLNSHVLLASIDAPTATIIAALAAAGATVAVRWIPKTRTEAAVDRATARVSDAEAWGQLVTELRSDNADLRTRLDSTETQLRDCQQEKLQLQKDYVAARAQLKQLRS